MNRFFKDMPEEMNEKGTWDIKVIAVFPCKEVVVQSETLKGKKWRAYLKVRIQAFKKDWRTKGESYDIKWTLNAIQE